MAVIFETSLGQFTIDLFCEERPKCSENFLKLCKMKYYNYCLFHSIQTNLVAQTGDPTGSGKGGYSIWQQIAGEKYFFNELKPKIKHRRSGLVSMVNNGHNKHGSQFFITLADNLDYLDGIHTVFGEISEGMDIVEKLNRVFVDKDNVPLRDVMVYHTVVLDDPFPDPPQLSVPECSPEPTEAQLTSRRIGAEEDIADESGLSAEERRELERVKEARANAQILAVIGDIPDEDARPPENVLFVCSLNPVTTSEDLEIVFSRFGAIASCEVIRDYKTGNSLQYAFIEFEAKEACVRAYYDMERVLIDDRRIHVDFSQSVAKQWRSYREDLRRRQREKHQRPAGGSGERRSRSNERRDPHNRSKERDNHHNRNEKDRRRSRSIERRGQRRRSNDDSRPHDRSSDRDRRKRDERDCRRDRSSHRSDEQSRRDCHNRK